MLTKFSVKKPYTVIVAVAIIMILGVAALMGLRTDLLPDVDYPYAVVITDYADASPEEVESTVTKPLEKALSSLGKTRSVNSVSTAERSIITVEFDESTDMDSIIAEMRESFEPLRAEWGSNVSSPVIHKINPDTMPVIVAAIDVEGAETTEASKFTEETLMGYFDGIDGIAELSTVGLISEQVQITIDPEKLAKINQTIFAAIDGDFAKAREALNATDAELSSASTRMSSDLLNRAASVDSQLRALNAQLAKARASETTCSDQVKAAQEELAALENEKSILDAKSELTEEESQRVEELGKQITEVRAKLSAAQSSTNGNTGEIAALSKQIADLETQRTALTSQMTTNESQLAQSRAAITKQLSDLDAAEETAKAKADMQTLITTEMVSSMLSAQNFSSTAGSLAMGDKEYDVKVGDKISSVSELENLVLFHFNIEGVNDVLLNQVANVSLVNDSEDVYARINGHDGVLLSFMKQSDCSTAEAAENVRAVFDKVTDRYPSVSITTLSDQSVYIDRVSHAVTENLIVGAILAVLVLFVFLRDVRPTLVVAVSIPMSLLFALVMMYFTGVSLNVFSLAGLALGVGMLVDNSIVVMENIYRCRSIGLSRADAALKGTKQVTGAIIASTLTTICVFLPVLFTDGISRQLFTDIGLTIAYALLASLLIAFTLVPSMSAGVLRKMERKPNPKEEKIKEKYVVVLNWVLGHRIFVLIFALLLVVFSAVFAVSKGTSFLPESDSTEMTVTVTMKEETTPQILFETTDKVAELIQDIPDVESVGAVSDGGGTVSFSGVTEGNSTTLYVALKDDKKQSSAELKKTILEQTENLDCYVDVSIGNYDLSSLYSDNIEITVTGEELSNLASITEDMGDLLLSVQGVENVKSTMDTATPTLKVTVNKTAAMKYGLTVSEVYEFISRSISNSANATTLSQTDTDVIVIDGGAGDFSLADIQNLKMNVTDDDGIVSEVVIGSIAAISEEEGAPVIYRDNQTRYMTATAEVSDGYNVGLVSDEVKELVEGYSVPDGYQVTIQGEESAISDSLKDLGIMLLFSFLLMYLIMVAQFQSLLSPLIIILTVPLSFTGGLLALLIGGKDLSIIAVVGFLLLSGIVVNNGIVLVDYIDRLRKSGKRMDKAIIEGCCTRLRPIVMTATTTILALTTLAFGFGVGAEIVQPMAIVVFGGMFYATFVTLFVVPALYDLIRRRKADTIAELASEDVFDDGADAEKQHRGKKILSAVNEKLHEIYDDDDEEESEDEENLYEDDVETETADSEKRHGLFASRKKRLAEEDEEEEDEEDDDDEEDRPSFLHRLFHRDEYDDDDDEEDEDDEEEYDDEDEEDRPSFLHRLFHRDEEDDDDDDEEYDEDEGEEDDDDEEESRGFFARLRGFFSSDDDDDDDEDDDDEDYYGLKARRGRSSDKEDE